MKTLRVSSFGLRGHVGTSLTVPVVQDYAAAFATSIEDGPVLLGRDTRYSSPMIASAVRSSLIGSGCEVLDFGVCPTPVLQFCTNRNDAGGALSISGGHMGMGWNAITLIGRDGACLDTNSGEAVLDLFHSGDFRKATFANQGGVTGCGNYFGAYLDRLCEVVCVDEIRNKNYTVLIDPVGGAGCAFLKPFADRFGLKLVSVNAEPSGYLAREPEPRPRSAQHLASFIKHVEGDIGFVLNSDVARVSIVTEEGEQASEEYSFAVVANHVLERLPGVVVTNSCTSRMVDDVASRHRAQLVKTRVGQAYIVAMLTDEQGVLGGEGSGSMVLPSFSLGFDGFLMMALILESMALSGRAASELLRALPKYHIIKDRRPCDAHAAYHAVDSIAKRLSEWADGTKESSDGVRFDWEDGWVHVRPSQTEQLIRIISESTDRVRAEQRAEEIAKRVEREL
jgi:phosphomannomutase